MLSPAKLPFVAKSLPRQNCFPRQSCCPQLSCHPWRGHPPPCSPHPRQKLPLSVKTPSLVVLKLPSLVKSPTIGNVNFHSESQYAFLGKVAFHGNMVILGKIAFLGKVAAVVIDSIVLVLLLVALASLPSLHLRCCQHHAGIFNLIVMAPVPSLQWCRPPFVALVSAQSRRRSRCMLVCCVCVVVILVVSIFEMIIQPLSKIIRRFEL
jgi:hypothetical protein